MKRILRRRLSRRFQRVKRRYIVLLTLLCATAVLCAAFIQCRPILQSFAESQALWKVTKTANEIAMAVLREEADTCTDVLSVVYDDTATVSAVYADTSVINRVRSTLTTAVMSAVERDASIAVSIPVGTLTGVHWLSGFGPLVSFPISYTATVLSNISSRLSDVAINQSVYSVDIHLYMSMYVVTPSGRSTVETTVTFPMAETVLLGEVPSNLTEVFGDDQSLTGQIFDYGTTQ